MRQRVTLLLFIISTICLDIKVSAALTEHHKGFELGMNTVQIDNTLGQSINGTQLLGELFLHERIEILNTYMQINQDKEFLIIQNDLRLRLWGIEAEDWHPGLALEFGYFDQNRDWLNKSISAANENKKNGSLFGGVWYFPLNKIEKGYAIAKWAYVIRPYAPDLVIFNCFAHWNIFKNVAVHFGGDIFREVGNLKFSGFVTGLAFQL